MREDTLVWQRVRISVRFTVMNLLNIRFFPNPSDDRSLSRRMTYCFSESLYCSTFRETIANTEPLRMGLGSIDGGGSAKLGCESVRPCQHLRWTAR